MNLRNGETFRPDACRECQCRFGSVQCRTTTCPPLLCHNPVRRPGECCPQCPQGNTEKYSTGGSTELLRCHTSGWLVYYNIWHAASINSEIVCWYLNACWAVFIQRVSLDRISLIKSPLSVRCIMSTMSTLLYQWEGGSQVAHSWQINEIVGPNN